MTDTMDDFLSHLASRDATPGGGSASALVGAIAAALCGMVGRLNDKKTGEPGPLHDTISPADDALQRLKALVDEDIAAFTELMATWKLPADDPQAAAKKQAATLRATEAPLRIMSAACDVMRLAAVGLERSKKNCLSDAGAAALLAHAAVEAARLNVMINLPAITDKQQQADLKGRAHQLRTAAASLRETATATLDRRYG